MKKTILIFLVLIFLFCEKRERIPSELKSAFEYFDNNWDMELIEKIKGIENEIPIARNVDYGIPAEIKNNLLQNNKSSKNLLRFFDSLGINQHDDMAGILLASFQKHLQGREINLSQQVIASKAYWEPILDCREKQRIRRLKIYHESEIGDTINVKMPVGENNSVVDYSCPKFDWDFKASKDLSIDGIIADKYIGEDSTDMILRVKVLTKNHMNTEILMEEVNIGDDFRIYLYETSWKLKTTGNNG